MLIRVVGRVYIFSNIDKERGKAIRMSAGPTSQSWGRHTVRHELSLKLMAFALAGSPESNNQLSSNKVFVLGAAVIVRDSRTKSVKRKAMEFFCLIFILIGFKSDDKGSNNIKT